MIKLIIVDDHKIFREGLKTLLEKIGKFEVIAEASNGQELIDILPYKKPDIILLDINMPVMDGTAAAEIISRDYPDIHILVLSMFGEEEYYHKMIQIGAKGFILKETGYRELEKALEDIYHGDCYFSQELLRRIIYKTSTQPKKTTLLTNQLTKREIEVLYFICKGFTNQEIADKLYISIRTVEIHKAHLLEKTNSKNTINLILYALKNKLVELDVD
jgi:DNA-binding NarL/FixJ family response regulator